MLWVCDFACPSWLLPVPFQAVYGGGVSTRSLSVLCTVPLLREFWSPSNLRFSLGALLEGCLLVRQGGKLQERCPRLMLKWSEINPVPRACPGGSTSAGSSLSPLLLLCTVLQGLWLFLVLYLQALDGRGALHINSKLLSDQGQTFFCAYH